MTRCTLQMLMSTLGCDANARLVCGANADVMLTLMLVALYSIGESERCMHVIVVEKMQCRGRRAVLRESQVMKVH